MAILNFPSNPTVGDTYEENGITYTWDGDKWIASSSGSGDIYVNVSGDTMTGDLTVPNLISEGDVQTTSLNGGPLAGLRSQIQNGLFQVRQRGDTFTSPADVYTFDRWWMGNAAARTVAFVKEGPFMSAMRVTDNSTDNVLLRQGIELQQGESGAFVQGTTWTLSLWSDSTGWAGRGLGVCAFRDAGKMNDSAGQRGQTSTPFVATGETNGVYKRFALQITIDTLPAATHEMLCVGLSLPSGGLRISGIQLEPGPVATPFEHRPIGLETSLCQRYYFKLVEAAIGTGSNGVPPHEMKIHYTLPTTMRVTPTLTETVNIGSINNRYPKTTNVSYAGTGNEFGNILLTDIAHDAEL